MKKINIIVVMVMKMCEMANNVVISNVCVKIMSSNVVVIVMVIILVIVIIDSNNNSNDI
jgi:hypothetical protein